ncbi:hypothetical protein [Vibrio owensii]|uniref:hypothetical protein n=1 Tax=Vibrio owensii TaxID=696485 RepID=UPI0040688E25
MEKYTTMEVALHMLNTGRYYTAGILAKELNISVYLASGKIFNIRNGKKYTTDTKGKPLEVKVTAIEDVPFPVQQSYKNSLWANLLHQAW